MYNNLFLTINLLDAVYLLSEAWEDVKSATIANCYRHAGFVKDPVIESVEFDVFHDIPLSANMSREQLLAEIDVDTNLDIAGSFSDEDLLNEAKRRRRNNPEFSEDE